jgi:hypothetical protein
MKTSSRIGTLGGVLALHCKLRGGTRKPYHVRVKRLPATAVATANVSSATTMKSTACVSTVEMSTAAVISARICPADISAVVAAGVRVARVEIGRWIVRWGRVLAAPVPAPCPLRRVCTYRLCRCNRRRQRCGESNDQESNQCRFSHGVFLQARLDCRKTH